jgi:small conductance mechanosensitive channel
LTYALVIVFVIIAVLQKFGVETASLVAVLGAATFAIGFALQGSLSNFAAGVMILMFRPYKVDDFVEAAGVSGSVKEIRLFTTILATPDNVKIIVPNSKIFGDIIKNYAAYDTRRVSIDVGISYSASIQKAFDVIMNIVKADERILPEPVPMIAVTALADSSVNLVVRAWVKKEDYWNLFFDLTRKVKETLDENGIEIPFPQRVVHMAETKAEKR